MRQIKKKTQEQGKNLKKVKTSNFMTIREERMISVGVLRNSLIFGKSKTTKILKIKLRSWIVAKRFQPQVPLTQNFLRFFTQNHLKTKNSTFQHSLKYQATTAYP
jgi:hypothetical protein